jgi:hypothetical protein
MPEVLSQSTIIPMFKIIPNGLCSPEEEQPSRGEFSATGIKDAFFHGPVPKRPRVTLLQRAVTQRDRDINFLRHNP